MHILAKVCIAIAIVGLVGVGSIQSAQTSSLSSADVSGSTLDDLTEKELAVFVADLAGIETVQKQQVVAEQLSYEPQTQSVVKAQVIKTDAETRHDIVKYTVKDGESLESIANKFGVSAESIKWASDISSDTVQAGFTLTVPPVDGVVYTVKADDTAQSIAETYKAKADDIVAFNDAELTGLKEGMKIVIPNGEKPAPEPTYYRSTTSASYASNFSPSYGGNSYSYGWCTWWAASRRAQLGAPVPSNWGNANTWAARASASGYNVSSTPKVGAIAQNSYMAGGLGHVAIVEKVSPDGSRVLISDMNGIAGWGDVGEDWQPTSMYTSYIH